MNAGLIASRYAKAFLKYVQEAGSGEKVYAQVCRLVRVIEELPQLKEYLKDSSVGSLDKKVSLLSAALDSPIEAAIPVFLKMVTDNHRVEYFHRMLLSFIDQYRAANNIKVGRLVTAIPDAGLGDRLEQLLKDKTGAEVHLSEEVDPDIIGGFIFELDGCRMDASVESHLNRIRRQLIEKNNRLV